jgi:cysteine sulfinate desulfinase/cysteine desulfurase-like protein
MKRVGNEQGVALVTALLLTLISLAITMALLSFILAGTRMSASQKRYHNALSAAYGGIEVSTRDLIPKIFNGYSSNSLTTSFSTINLAVHSSNACLQQKLFLRSSDWTACGTSATVSNAAVAPDVRFTLQGINNQSNFNIAAKIVDTVPGNSDPSGTEMLDAGMAVAGTSPGVSPMHLPSLITIEVEGTQGSKPQEKADLSVLYAY